MRPRLFAATILALAVATLPFVYGCGSREGTPIEPLPSSNGGTEFRLGEGVEAMSRGPGDKSSPVWSPNDRRMAFIVDGYVVDEPVGGGDERVWTARDFEARKIMWSGNSSILATAASSGEAPDSQVDALYRSLAPSGSAEVSEVVARTLSSTPAGDEAYLVSLDDSSGGDPPSSSLALVQDGELSQTYPESVSGEVTGLSVSPDGSRAILSVRLPGDRLRYELRIFDPSDGTSERVLRLDKGLEIFGSPQWANGGIYYVAGGDSKDTAGGDTSRGRLYLMSSSGESETAPGVGRAFTASNIKLSPDGKRLAVIGRLRPDSQTNLHLLNLETEELGALTSSDDMEIKNGSNDLSWSPDGEEVAFVARGASSGTRIYPGPASSLLEEFYNVYRISASEERSEG